MRRGHFHLLYVGYLLIVVVFLAGVGHCTAVASAQETETRQFPRSLVEWELTEYHDMTSTERWFYLHGVSMGTVAIYNTVMEALRTNVTEEELLARLDPFRRYLRTNVNDIHQRMEALLPRDGGRPASGGPPLWVIPFHVTGGHVH